jgi:multidrug efflux pump
VVGITLTLAAVYAPIAFVDGLTGKLFREFAFTLAAAVVISGIIALTLAPMMCARLLKPVDHHAKAEGRSALRALASRLVHIIDSRFERLKLSYQRTLDASLNVRWAAGAIGVMLLAASLMFYQKTPKELAPDEDQGFVFMLFSAPQWGNLDYLDHYVQRMDDIFKTFPEYETSFLINGDGSNTTSGFGGMTLKPWSERERSTADIVPELAGKLRALTGIDVFATADTFLPGTGGGLPVQVVIRSQGDFEALAQAAEALETAAMTSGYFIFADNSLTFDKPAIDVDIDRTKASQMGVSMADIGDTLATLLGGNYVNLFEMEGRSYRVVPQVARVDRLTPELLGSYYVRAASGALVPLSTFVTLTRTVQPNALTTFQQLNSATIAGVPYPGRTTGEAVAFLERAAADILPPGMSLDYAGETRQFKQEGARLGLTFGFAMLIIFLVLAAQFESFRDPVIVLVSVPLSLAGALLALNIGSVLQVPGATINIYTQIGLITLAGLISKHGILMVDFANHLQRQFGYDRRQAIVEAAAIRLRPILMTTAAMVAGVLPLLLATGPGANSRFAIGLVIAAGLTIGTLLTLFIVPAVYTWLAADHREPAKDSTGSAALGDSGAVAQPAE